MSAGWNSVGALTGCRLGGIQRLSAEVVADIGPTRRACSRHQ